MVAKIPAHLRANFEQTDSTIETIRGLIYALDALRDAEPAPEPSSNIGIATTALMTLLLLQSEKLDHDRQMEWSGIGGESRTLTAEEVAKSRAKPAESINPKE
jgi:hypothetical protein